MQSRGPNNGDATGNRTPVTGETVRYNNRYTMAPYKIRWRNSIDRNLSAYSARVALTAPQYAPIAIYKSQGNYSYQ